MNVRPLWSLAAEVLAHCFGDTVWVSAFGELRAISQIQGCGDQGIPGWMGNVSEGDEDDDNVMEEERTWRDPSAHKLHLAVGKWLRDDHQWKEIIRVSKNHANIKVF